jgi:foldase protein PrsA
MKDFVKSTNLKVSLLCLGMVVIGVGIGMLINNARIIPALADGSEVIAQIDGKKFTADDLYNKLKGQGGESVLTNMIDEYIVGKEIKDMKESNQYADSYIKNLKSQYQSYGENFQDALTKAGYATEADFAKLVAQDHAKKTVAEKYIKAHYFKDDEIKDYYDKNIEGPMNVRYVLVTPDEVDKNDKEHDKKTQENEAKALATANEVIKKLEEGKDFADLAKKYSDDSTTASQGGLYSGFSKKDVVEEFWNAAKDLKDGKYTTSPVKSSYGYFVILRINQDEKPSLKDSKDEVVSGLLADLEAKDSDITTKAWVEVRKSYNLNIVDNDIKKAYETTVKSYDKK